METKGVSTEKKVESEGKTAEKKKSKKSDKSFFSKLGKIFTLKRIIIFLVLCGIGFGLWWFFFGKDMNENVTAQTYTEYTVNRQNVIETISASGVIEPLDRYEITSRVMGEIIEAPFEEGDTVNEGDTLYRIDDEDAQLNIEKAENNITKSEHSVKTSKSNIEKAENSITKAENNVTKAENNVTKAQDALDDVNEEIGKLTVYAKASGKLSNFNIKKNDTVSPSTIANIIDTEKRTIELPFFVADADSVKVGDSVTLTSALYMESIPGTVSHKYDVISENGGDGSACKNIEIEIKNPKNLDSTSTFAATIHTSSGDFMSATSGKFEEPETISVKAEVAGTASKINFHNGDYVKEGDVIMVLESESLQNTKKDCERTLKESKISLTEANMSLTETKMGYEESKIGLQNSELNLEDSQFNKESTEKALEDYNITAPISGTIITKNSKVGDNINNASGQTVMMVIADTSKMKFAIEVDELEISKLQVGQKATIDADAFPSKMFDGTVTSIAGEGVSTGNGVTTFTVEITIDNPGELKSGMNVNANIIINRAENVLTIPEDALSGVRGTRASVLVMTAKSKPASESVKSGNGQTPPDGAQKFSPPSDKEGNFGGEKAPQMNSEKTPESGEMPKSGKTPEMSTEKSQEKASEDKKSLESGKPQQSATGFPGGAAPGTMPTGGNAQKAGMGTMPNAANMNLPEGCEMRMVEIGISDGRFVEIVSGLSEGDVIVYTPSVASGNMPMMGMGMMGGMPRAGMGMGSMGGGMPRGGMSSGNNRSGGMTGR